MTNETKDIIVGSILLTTIIVIPIIVAIITYRRFVYKNKTLEEIYFSFGQIWSKVGAIKITGANIAKLFLVIIPAYIISLLLSDLPHLSALVNKISVFILILWAIKVYKEQPKLDNDRPERFLEELNMMIGKVVDTKLHADELLRIIEARDREIQKKEEIKKKLEHEITQKEKESATWDSFSQEQQAFVVDSIKKIRLNKVLELLLG